MDYTSTIIKLVLAALFGIIMGFQREMKEKPAGIKTYGLVCLGACAFTILSTKFFPGDPARMVSQIIIGIGFIGAGIVFKTGVEVVGLTTAAGVWTSAAVGIALGVGSYFMAVVLLILIVLLFLPHHGLLLRVSKGIVGFGKKKKRKKK